MLNQRVAGHLQFLTFALGREIFAVEVLKVREILDAIEPTAVPQMPPEFLGVINLRGKVVPVIDLRRKFGLAAVERTRDQCIVILEVTVEGEKTTVGALADAVKEVMTLNPDQIEPPPRMGSRLRTEYIRGMGKRGDEFMIVLDVDRIFSVDELSLYDETAEVPAAQSV